MAAARVRWESALADEPWCCGHVETEVVMDGWDRGLRSCHVTSVVKTEVLVSLRTRHLNSDTPRADSVPPGIMWSPN